MPITYDQIQMRRGPAIDWATINPVLASGEWGVEVGAPGTPDRVKLGNGVTPWNQLDYKSERGLPGIPGAVGPKGDAGPAGPQGPKGEDGAPAAFSIGSVSQGTAPSASISGTAENPILNLVLPKGDTGSSGAIPVIGIGTVTSGSTPAATMGGTTAAPLLNLVLPQGPAGPAGGVGPAGATGSPGPTGPAGPAGAAAVFKGVFQTTWPPITSPSPALGDLWILGGTTIPSGTPSAAAIGDGFVYVGGATSNSTQANGWLDVGPLRGPAGPKGDKGDVGLQGPAGGQGIQGVQGVAGSAGPAGPSPTLAIGTVTTGPTAAASITGTSPNFFVHLVLPLAAATQQSTVFTVSPKDTTVLAGATVTFTATAQSTESPIVYAWERMAPGGSTWSVISGATTSSLSASVVIGDSGAKYRCSATTTTVGKVYSQIATLSVSSVPPANGTSWTLGSGTTDYAPGLLGGQQAAKSGAVEFASDVAGGVFSSGFSYSTDGISWRSCPAPIWSQSNHKGILRGNGFFFAMSDAWTQGRVPLTAYTSFDGQTWAAWTANNGSVSLFLEGVQSYAFGGGKFLVTPHKPEWSTAVSQSNDLWQTTFATGAVFTSVSTNLGQVWADAEVRYANNKWFARLTDGYYYYSSNGTTWARCQLSSVDFYFGAPVAAQFDVAWNGSKYVMVTPGNLAFTSTDGIAWTAYSIGTASFWREVQFGNGMFIAVDGTATCITSSDGQTWTALNNMPVNASYTPAWSTLAFGNGRFVAAGKSVYTGRDGVAVNNLCYSG